MSKPIGIRAARVARPAPAPEIGPGHSGRGPAPAMSVTATHCADSWDDSWDESFCFAVVVKVEICVAPGFVGNTYTTHHTTPGHATPHNACDSHMSHTTTPHIHNGYTKGVHLQGRSFCSDAPERRSQLSTGSKLFHLPKEPHATPEPRHAGPIRHRSLFWRETRESRTPIFYRCASLIGASANFLWGPSGCVFVGNYPPPTFYWWLGECVQCHLFLAVDVDDSNWLSFQQGTS